MAYVTGLTNLVASTGANIPALVLQDSASSLAIPQTSFVLAASGLLLPAPVDANNNPIVTTSGGVVNVQALTIPTGQTAYISSSMQVAVGNLTINGTLASYGVLRCLSITFGIGGSLIKGNGSTTEIGII
jgi:hypothetical protein